MKTKRFFGIMQKNSVKMYPNNSFEEVVGIAIENSLNVVIERYYDINDFLKQRIYAWNSSLVDGIFLKEIFAEDAEISELLHEKCKSKNPTFLYIPYNAVLESEDKRDFLPLDDISAVTILKEPAIISIVQDIWNGSDYSYGSHSCLLRSSIPLDIAVAKAKENGYGFVVRYLPNNKRIIIAWDAEVLTYNQALQKFANDNESLYYVIEHYKSGHKNFVCSNAEKTDLFPLDFFEGFKSIKA